MTKIPQNPQEIFQDFSTDYKSVFEDELVSIILYGSGAKGEYVPKKSDINFLIVLSEKGMEELNKSLDLVARWKKRRVTTPLFLTKSYITSSLDSFPMEFLDMRGHHQLVYGEDVLAGLEIEKHNLRLQCEREIKSKLLHLRQAYLDTHGKRKPIEDLISRSVVPFASIFRALLYLKGKEIPPKRRDVILQTVEEFGLKEDTFENLLKISEIRYGGREGTVKLSAEELSSLMEEYIEEIRVLSRKVDAM